jgi:site-specific DNA-methyltransferase (adenine-specific)
LTSRNKASQGGASRFFYVAKASKSERNKGLDDFEEKESKKFDGGEFNSASTNANERTNKNFHPTVKPIKLMEYLVKMITPPNGIVLDPFVGSGTTGVAAKLLGFDFVGIEQDAEYCKIAQARVGNSIVELPAPVKPIKQLSLF